LEKDLQNILDNGFKIEERKYLVPLPFQLIIIFTNIIQYIFGYKTAKGLQKLLRPIGYFIEKYFSFKPLCAEQCIILRKI
jgi:hypothetical protein